MLSAVSRCCFRTVIKFRSFFRVLPEQIARLEFPAVAVARADHFRDAKMIRKTQRPAAQRRETGSEDHSVVGILRRRDDLSSRQRAASFTIR